MTTVSLTEASSRLAELVHGLEPGDVLVITENDEPVAQLTASASSAKQEPRRLGTMRGTVLYMADDFDAPLEDFEEYMG